MHQQSAHLAGEYDVMAPQCPSRTVLRHVVDRWTPLIVTSLSEGPMRFTQLRDRVGGVTPKVLTQTLRSMERDGLLTRHVFSSIPPRVDYTLTELGQSLITPMDALRSWAEDNASEILENRQKYDFANI